MNPKLYGIPNCDAVKRARAWFAAQAVPTTFHDFKTSGVPADRLDAWIAALGWEALVNRRGTTWRGLGDAVQAGVVDSTGARRLLLDHASAIRRPVVEWPDGSVTVCFDPLDWAGSLRSRGC